MLKHNLFKFNDNLYQQKTGTAMGTRVAPTMENIFMAEINELIQECAINENLNYSITISVLLTISS
jgi:hypothetical protein